MRIALPTLVATALLLGLAPSAHAVPAETGRTVELRLSRVPLGLERWLARDSRWRAAIEAVRGHELHRSLDLFQDAEAEVRRAATLGRIPGPEAHALVAKADFEAAQVHALLEAQREISRYSPFEKRYIGAVAWHNLYLTARAYFGHGDGALEDRAAKAYLAALALATPDQQPALHIAYAGLLADGGHPRAARAELAKVSASEREGLDVAFNLAHLYAALGDRARAFERLDYVRDNHVGWNLIRLYARIDNDFDTLRGDPRFVRLVGGDGED